MASPDISRDLLPLYLNDTVSSGWTHCFLLFTQITNNVPSHCFTSGELHFPQYCERRLYFFLSASFENCKNHIFTFTFLCSGIHENIYTLACIERTCLDVHMWTNIHRSIHNVLSKGPFTFDLSPYWHMTCSTCQKRKSREPEKNRLITMKRKLHQRREGCFKSSWWVTSNTDWFMGDSCEMRLNSEWQTADTVTICYWDPVAWISISLAMLQMLSCELNYSRMTGSINYLNLCHNNSHSYINWKFFGT